MGVGNVAIQREMGVLGHVWMLALLLCRIKARYAARKIAIVPVLQVNVVPVLPVILGPARRVLELELELEAVVPLIAPENVVVCLTVAVVLAMTRA